MTKENHTHTPRTVEVTNGRRAGYCEKMLSRYAVL